MKFLFVIFFSLLLFKVNAQDLDYNDPNSVSRNISADFHAVKVSNGIELILSQSNSVALAENNHQ